ncbi:hypothetical protein F5Y04DRAFT_256637 [Hypomontagnella monticulosa]|nr:hypothetical protein F5Y04DRAFT_256637 [Hypomontagnella monticulosa]
MTHPRVYGCFKLPSATYWLAVLVLCSDLQLHTYVKLMIRGIDGFMGVNTASNATLLPGCSVGQGILLKSLSNT